MAEESDLKLFGQQILSSAKNKEYKSRLAGLGIFVNVIWVLSVFIRPVIEPVPLITLGGISFIITVGTRLQSRNLKSVVAGEVSGGSIVGYIIAWFLVHLGYPNKAYQIGMSPEIAFTVNQILIFYLVLIFFIWFAIPASTVFEEIIFGLPPLISYFILNLWKLAVILEILTLLEELRALNPYADFIFLLIGFVELILQYIRLVKLPIADIILDPMQLFFKTVEGPLQTLKWSFLVIIFLIMDILPFDLFSAGLIAFSLTMGIISLTTALSKIIFDSGVIRSRTDNLVEDSKVIIPKVFEELKQLEASNLQEFYRVSERISIKKKNKIINYNTGDIFLKLPFTDTLEKEAGVFLANLKLSYSRSDLNKVKIQEHDKSVVYFKSITKSVTVTNNKKRKNINISSLHRIPHEEWEEITRNEQVELMEPTTITSMMGFDSPEEFEKVVEKGIRDAISFQENIRDRIRGVPVTVSNTNSKVVKLKNRHIEVPDELLEKIKLTEDQEIELIPGKEEFLFYARIKKKKDS